MRLLLLGASALVFLSGCRTAVATFQQDDCTNVAYWEVLQQAEPVPNPPSPQVVGIIDFSSQPFGCEPGIPGVANIAVDDATVMVWIRARAADGSASDLSNGIDV